MQITNKITKHELNRFLKKIKKQLLLTHSRQEATAILQMLQTSIDEFIDDNPTATMDDIKKYFADYNSLNDIELYNIDSKILEEKLNHSKAIKQIAFVILFLIVFAFILYVVLYLKSYIDVQNSIDAYKIIEIN